ncbi:MAG: N-glycosylase/DNA lyase [Candidatus Desulfofervidaceae bacterium]|nr:N-glycosylase/DNA lyase [Candidatus Desulfofervidaceae bacterium]MDL1971415.1 N-glycosylase/DNA lyase [Candidatus Desulfofervidaceae bacterium]
MLRIGQPQNVQKNLFFCLNLFIKKIEHIWQELALTMNQPLHKKTIVFGMKCLVIGLMELDIKNISFDLPIPVDSRIKELTRDLRLLERELTDKNVQRVWEMVLKELKKKYPEINMLYLCPALKEVITKNKKKKAKKGVF